LTPRGINPKTGKRFAWEEEQRQARGEDLREVKKHIALLERQGKAVEARDKFLPFVKFTSPDPEDPNDVHKSKYKDAKHHRSIARVVEDVVDGDIMVHRQVSAPERRGRDV
jgi:hypothetical protein